MKLKLFHFIIILLILFVVHETVDGQVIINEICPANSSIILDTDGDYSDWIELYNAGTEAVDLNDSYLSDDPDDLTKWLFPEYILNSGEYLIVFTSGKNEAGEALYWQTLINQGDDWKYLRPNAGTSQDWRNPGFNDASWDEGPSGIGYGDGDDATEIPSTIAVYLRKTFTITDPSSVTEGILHIDFDDGFVAYLNGTEIARSYMSGSPPAYDALATASREAQMYQGNKPARYSIPNFTSNITSGENLLAIEVHNTSATSSDLSAIPFLSMRSTAKPASEPPVILELSNAYPHTNFRLDADGDSLFYSNSQGLILDSVYIPVMYTDHSYGRKPGSGLDWYIYDVPTPGMLNNTTAYESQLDDLPEFSKAGGVFTGSFQLSLTAPEAGDSIFYTTDGSEPDGSSDLYQGALEIVSSAVIRARILKTGYLPGRTVTNTYFEAPDSPLPVVSITTDPYNLWDYNSGIYVKGPNAQGSFPFFDANFWQDWERPVYVEMYDEDGNKAFGIDAGIKMYGGWTRGFPQKSMAVFARNKYGANKIEYALFEDKDIDSFEAFVLRNSGNDWFGVNEDGWAEPGIMFRDALMTSLTRGMDVEHQAARQAVLYLNGEYWGIHNIREKINEHFLAANKGVDPDNVDRLERQSEIIQGSQQHYGELLTFLNSNDIKIRENYEHVKKQMDIQNFINYEVAQIYFDNRDWPGNNIKYWRSADATGKWRWILYDTDFGFGMWDLNKMYFNTLDFALEPNGPGWPNPPWSTFLLRKLIQNNEFKNLFINSFADRMNTNFQADMVINRINELSTGIEDEIYNHIDKWGGSHSNWSARVSHLHTFANGRASHVRGHIRSEFGIAAIRDVNLSTNIQDAGYIKLNTIFVKEFPWEGIYFQGIPIELIAIPNPGYKFTGWSGSSESGSPRITVPVESTLNLIANFEIDGSPDSGKVIINEICYTQDSTNNPEDWIELYNNSDQYVDISGWILKDSNDLHTYQVDEKVLLAPWRYYVLSRNQNAFTAVYPEVTNYEGSFDFGISSRGECVRLYNSQLDLVDSVHYGIAYPWPNVTTGYYTLSLLDPDLDNDLGESWAASYKLYGTPGRLNSDNTGIRGEMLAGTENVSLMSYPNPFSSSTNILVYSGQYQQVKISVYDMNGRLIDIITSAHLEAGRHEFEWSPDNLQDGLYILRLETRGSVLNQKLIKTGF